MLSIYLERCVVTNLGCVVTITDYILGWELVDYHATELESYKTVTVHGPCSIQLLFHHHNLFLLLILIFFFPLLFGLTSGLFPSRSSSHATKASLPPSSNYDNSALRFYESHMFSWEVVASRSRLHCHVTSRLLMPHQAEYLNPLKTKLV
jgi:hypothetical protein